MHSIAQQKQFTPRRRSDATTAVCLSVCLSFVRSVSRITHDRVTHVDQTWQARARRDPPSFGVYPAVNLRPVSHFH